MTRILRTPLTLLKGLGTLAIMLAAAFILSLGFLLMTVYELGALWSAEREIA